ncbi:hypothetical protein RCO48_00495 [Peribacillus frigoritolerans]|nr:hypothetical protein [Peribacillus frigoritolerans]
MKKASRFVLMKSLKKDCNTTSFFNHLLGLINNFGTEGLVSENKLLQLVQEQLETCSRDSEDEGLNRVVSKLLHARN